MHTHPSTVFFSSVRTKWAEVNEPSCCRAFEEQNNLIIKLRNFLSCERNKTRGHFLIKILEKLTTFNVEIARKKKNQRQE